MKKILFVINNLNMGGIQKSLIELLQCIHKDYDITLYSIDNEGELRAQIPQSVKVVFGDRFISLSEKSLKQARNSGIFAALLRGMLVLTGRFFGKAAAVNMLFLFVMKLKGSYDAAISFSQPTADDSLCVLTNEFVDRACSAKKKITFLHCDFEYYNTSYNRGIYKKFDAIAAVSQSVGTQFERFVPEMAGRIFTVRNCHNYDNIIESALQDTVQYDVRPAIVTVARLSKEKGLLRCVPVLKELKAAGHNFKWHIIGAGPVEPALRKLISESDLEDEIILHGQQNNPYRYIMNADYVLLPSYHEAAPMIFDEAMCLGVRILTTNTLSAKELVQDRDLGTVCENSASGLKQMLTQAIIEYKENQQDRAASLEMAKEENKNAIEQFAAICR